MLRHSQSPMHGLVVSVIALVFALGVNADEIAHKYHEGDDLTIWVNKIGPYHNPQETYRYYQLPFCKGHDHVEQTKKLGLGEALEGNALESSGFKLKFRKEQETQSICSEKLRDSDYETFREAIKENYWYQLYLDDLPMWGFVGEYRGGASNQMQEQVYIYTHKVFTVAANQDRIIEANLTSENPVELRSGMNLDFTYSVHWVDTNTPFEKRFERYLDLHFFEHQIHWFSIFNSFMMVIFLTGLVSLILMRTLRNDYARYSKDEDEFEELDRDVGDEYGWKQIHGDVFRAPPHLVLFSALIGSGSQLAILVLCVILFAIVGTLYDSRGALITSFIVSYAMTSCVSGYVGGAYYARSQGRHWIKTMTLTALLFPSICLVMGLILNSIAFSYSSVMTISFQYLLVMILIWAFISLPLTFVGTLIGRHVSGKSSNPCRINSIPRPIPEKKWFMQPWAVVAMGGVLPFGSIFIEMYFVFTSFWNYKFYYVYGFMLLVYTILVIVTMCVTIVSTYFLLNAEDYRWPWISFFSSASTAGYVWLYSIYYFFIKTKMRGFFQTSFYFGYMLMFCIGLGILCGTIGVLGTSLFVRRIYRNIKSD